MKGNEALIWTEHKGLGLSKKGRMVLHEWKYLEQTNIKLLIIQNTTAQFKVWKMKDDTKLKKLKLGKTSMKQTYAITSSLYMDTIKFVVSAMHRR